MQLHISRSMRSITISSSNEFSDLMKIKVAPRHISYRTLFHTILILAFLLPFVFIVTALVTLEGVNKCSSIDCLGRRLGPRLLGRIDDSERLVRDFYKILNEASTQDIPDGLNLPNSFRQLVSYMKNNHYDAKSFSLVLRAMIEKFERDIRESKFSELMNKHFAASSIPKGIHCLSLRLTDEYTSNAHARRQLPSPEFLPLLSDNAYDTVKRRLLNLGGKLVEKEEIMKFSRRTTQENNPTLIPSENFKETAEYSGICPNHP